MPWSNSQKWFCSWVLILLFSALAKADDVWVGKQIIPKRGKPKIYKSGASGEVDVGTIDYCPVPVREEKGEWVKVQVRNVAGWILKNEVVRMDDGIQYFTNRIQSKDDVAEAYEQRAWLWAMKGETLLAMKDADEAIRLASSPTAYNTRAVAWSTRGDQEKAIQDLNEAIRLNPKYAAALLNRGNIWMDKAKFENAIQDYSEAIRLDPNFAPAFTNRGNAWIGKKEYGKAIQDYSEAIRLDPQDLKALDNKAFVLASCADNKLRDIDKADELMKTIIALRPTSPWNEELLGVIDAARGRFEEAINHQKKALEDKEYATNEGDRAKERLKAYEAKKPWRE